MISLWTTPTGKPNFGPYGLLSARNGRGCPRSSSARAAARYPVGMTLATLSPRRRKALISALAKVLEPAQAAAAREFILAEKPGRAEPQPEEILFWMRANMPLATVRVEELMRSSSR